MDLKLMKRIVDCMSPREAVSLWGLEAVAYELGLDSVAKEAADAAYKLADLQSQLVRIHREMSDIRDSTVSIRPQILMEIEHRQNADEDCC